jgi:pimeloyl-ACP methyl ester carboxylesterase
MTVSPSTFPATGRARGVTCSTASGWPTTPTIWPRPLPSCRPKPVLVGHSMGTLVVQRYLAKAHAAGVALLAPVPPTGTGGSASRLALLQPDFFRSCPR